MKKSHNYYCSFSSFIFWRGAQEVLKPSFILGYLPSSVASMDPSGSPGLEPSPLPSYVPSSKLQLFSHFFGPNFIVLNQVLFLVLFQLVLQVLLLHKSNLATTTTTTTTSTGILRLDVGA
jgi:hypothetical protein